MRNRWAIAPNTKASPRPPTIVAIRGVLWSIYQSLEFDKQDAATEELASSQSEARSLPQSYPRHARGQRSMANALF